MAIWYVGLGLILILTFWSSYTDYTNNVGNEKMLEYLELRYIRWEIILLFDLL